MNAERYIDADASLIVPKPFFIVGKHALDEPVRSNPPSARSNFWSDLSVALVFVATVGLWAVGVI